MTEAARAEVRRLADEVRETRTRLEEEARQQIDAAVAEIVDELEQAILHALNTGESVTAVATSYTPHGAKSLHRAYIYDVRKRRAAEVQEYTGVVPFEWKPRVVESARGERTVYDVLARLDEFGPERLSSTHIWRYDSGRLEEVFGGPGEDSYPTTPFYQNALATWHEANPYPGRTTT